MRSEGPRQHAEDCLRRAKGAHAPGAKALLLQMAETWLSMAEKSEKAIGPVRRGRAEGGDVPAIDGVSARGLARPR
jgi:hypothetical protein